METLGLDLECFYGDEYTLSKMSTEAYVRDPRASEIMWAVKDGHATYWLLPDRAADYFANEVDWANTAVIAHHAHFDGLWLAHHHNVRPAMWIDTLSMARAIDGPKAGNSLHDLCIRHGIGEKGNYVTFAKGKHLADFTNAELQAFGQYACNDIDRTYDLAMKFLPLLPEDELRLIDLTVRMFTEPVFHGDVAKLRSAVASERQRKTELLQRIGLICPHCSGTGTNPTPQLDGTLHPCKKCDGLGVNKKPIGSNDQFADLLRRFGVEPETKTSPTTGGQIYAFARTDAAMQSLLEYPDEEVRFLAEARVAVKSNIVETRAEKFAASASRGAMPVYIAHAGAHTLRPSGGDGMNWLNMSKDIEGMVRPEMAVLRQSIQAPSGHLITAVDSSQGEARLLAWQANQMDLVEAFAQGRDIYSEFASDVYQRPVDRRKVKADYIPGQVGKIGILSFGFGSGWYTAALGFLKGVLGAPPIQFTQVEMEAMHIDPSRFLNSPNKIARVRAMPSRLGFSDLAIHCIVVEALVQRYRQRYPMICDFKTGYWALLEQVINAMIQGEEMVFGAHGIMRTGKECIHMPTGLTLHYRGIERDQEANASYWDGRKRTAIYGSLLAENLTQSLHRIVVSHQMLQIADAGIKVALWPYDEVVAVTPADAADVARQYMIEVMKTSPDWAVGLPLAAEGGTGFTYAEC